MLIALWLVSIAGAVLITAAHVRGKVQVEERRHLVHRYFYREGPYGEEEYRLSASQDVWAEFDERRS